MSRRMFRWIATLEDYGFDYKIEYQPGRSNVVADALSRMVLSNITATSWPETLIQRLDPIDQGTISDAIKKKMLIV